MSLFSFGDIKFNKGDLTRKGPLSALTKSEYETNNLRYPIDIGNADKGHYMVFYVRKQDKTEAGGGQNPVSPEALVPSVGAIDGLSAKAKSLTSGGITTNFSSATSKIPGIGNIDTSIGGDLVGKIQSGISQLDGAMGGALSGIQSSLGKVSGNIQGGLKNVFGSTTLPKGGDSAQSRSVIQNNVASVKGGSLQFLKTTKRTSEAISLYMPDTLMFNQTQSYDQLNIGGGLPGQLLAAGEANADAIKAGLAAGKEGDMSAGLAAIESVDKAALARQGGMFAGAQVAKTFGGGSGAGELAFTAATGAVVNPMLEMIYRSPNFRSFQFDFNFFPRDEKEALEVQKILKAFTFHQAPEKLAGVPGFLVPPSEFDIEFYYGGRINPNIPGIAPGCILTTIDINYAPSGASFYEVPGETSPSLGGTGMPFAVNLVLQFQETTYLTKSDYDDTIGNSLSGSETSKTTSTGVSKALKNTTGGFRT